MTVIKATDIAEPHALTTTAPPSGTYHEHKIPAGEGVLMYWPEQNGFLALYPGEYRELQAEADEHSKKIEALQVANRKVTEASVVLREAHKSGIAANIKKADAVLEAAINEMQRASAELKKKLEPLSKMDAKDGVKMVELVSLKTPKYKGKPVPIYVTSPRLKKILAENRVHLLSGEKSKRPEEKVWKDDKLDIREIKKRIAEKVQDQGFKKKWELKPEDADAYTGVLTEWARTMNGEISTFLERNKDDVEKKFNIDPKDSHRNVDLSAEAQLMRYTAGAGLEVNFKPFQGNLHDRRDDSWYKSVKRGLKSGELAIKGSAVASFAIAEGCAKAEIYWPHYAGFHVSGPIAGKSFDFGYWRFYGSLTLSGSAGASVAVELDIGVTYTAGRQGIRGIPPAQRSKGAVKARAGASAELEVFAGGRGGTDLNGTLQWLNPEGAESNGQPLAIRPVKAVAEFKDMAKVDAGVGGNAGIGIKGAFTIRHEDGKFVIYAKLGACLGLGADGHFKFEAGYETIGEFFKCVAYQLKRADFHKIVDVIDIEAYKAYCMVKYLVVAKGHALEKYAVKEMEQLQAEFRKIVQVIDNALSNGSAEAAEFLRRIRAELSRQTGSWLNYSAPEVLGKIMQQITVAGKSENRLLREQAPELMALALRAPQSMNHLNTVAERMTPKMGEKQEEAAGLAAIRACLAGSSYGECLMQTEMRLALASPMISTPFIWNSEPEFVVTKLAMEHPMYV